MQHRANKQGKEPTITACCTSWWLCSHMFLRIWFAAFFRALLADFEATVNGYIKAWAETEIYFLIRTSKLSGALWQRGNGELASRLIISFDTTQQLYPAQDTTAGDGSKVESGMRESGKTLPILCQCSLKLGSNDFQPVEGKAADKTRKILSKSCIERFWELICVIMKFSKYWHCFNSFFSVFQSATVDFVTVIHKQQQQQQQQQDQYLWMMFANVCKQLMDKSSN